MTASRTDANQATIVSDLRMAGASVQILTKVRKGCPDLLIGYRGTNYLQEVKTETGELTPDELEWHQAWAGQVTIVRNSREALQNIGAIAATPKKGLGT